MITVNIIGAGKLGKTLGRLLSHNQDISIQAICNTTQISAEKSIDFIGQGEAYCDINNLPPADISFITTPDDAIETVAHKLSLSQKLKANSTICHFSGALSSTILDKVKRKGCRIMSAHPMHSFAKPELSIHSFAGSYCALEGNETSIELVGSVLKSIGAITFRVNSDKKNLYHSGGVIASNYLVTLCHQAKLKLVEAGIDEELAMKIATNLMEGTVQNLKATLSPEHSLTGPIKRADTDTISNHMQGITITQTKQLYSLLGNLTIDIAKLSSKETQQIKAALKLESTPP